MSHLPKLPEDAPLQDIQIMGTTLDACLDDVRNVLTERYLDGRHPHANVLRDELLSVERHLYAACEMLGGPV